MVGTPDDARHESAQDSSGREPEQRVEAPDTASAVLDGSRGGDPSMTGTDPRAAFDEISRIVVGEQPLRAVLERVAWLAREIVPDVDEASVTLLRDKQPVTVSFTGALAYTLDERQYDAGLGPCLEAAATGETILVKDTSLDDRYPEFSQTAARAGVRRSMSVGLPIPQRTIGALNLYSLSDGEFDEPSQDLARTFAGYAAVALANAALHDSTVLVTKQLEQALTSRAVIDQAKGALIAIHGITADEAFDLLVKTSQDRQTKLRDVAAELLERLSSGKAARRD